MSRLSKFQKKPKKVELTLPGGEKETLEVKPLKTPDLHLMIDLGKPEKMEEATHKIVKKVLKDNIPDFTEEEYKQMSYGYIDEILNAAMDVNTVDKGSTKAKMLEEVKRKQQAAGGGKADKK